MLDYEDIIQHHPLPHRGVLRHHQGLGHSVGNASRGSMTISIPSLITPHRGQHALFRALEEFESLEKQEAGVQLRTVLTKSLTEIVTGESYVSPNHAIEDLEALSQRVPRRVCQHPFKKNDIVWVCRTCQADETCVLCHACFKASTHEGHDVAFYHAQAGGCVSYLLDFVLPVLVMESTSYVSPTFFCPSYFSLGNSATVVIQVSNVANTPPSCYFLRANGLVSLLSMLVRVQPVLSLTSRPPYIKFL